jgi:uncharacterized small protein (DUF1192 family)
VSEWGPRFDGESNCKRHGEPACPSCLAYANGDLRAEIAALKAEVAALRAERDRLRNLCEWGTSDPVGPKYDRLLAAEARVEVLTTALDGVWCAMDAKSQKCWCAYARLIHPQDDPQDALDLEPNGHTKECNFARRALEGDK